jgi:hypothetical protein
MTPEEFAKELHQKPNVVKPAGGMVFAGVEAKSLPNVIMSVITRVKERMPQQVQQ